jgi:hypothetical protein
MMKWLCDSSFANQIVLACLCLQFLLIKRPVLFSVENWGWISTLSTYLYVVVIRSTVIDFLSSFLHSLLHF